MIEVCSRIGGTLPFRRRLSTFVSRSPSLQLASPDLLNAIVGHFNAPIRYAIAYGSGVYRQSLESSNTGGKQIDLVFGVTHPQHWHSLNLRQNPTHYSALGNFGAPAIAHLQAKYGARVYYNPYVTLKIEGYGPVSVKYGVVSVDDLCDDMENWSFLYLAGRLQKPCFVVRDAPRVHLSNQINLSNAIAAALLQLPKTFSEEELFRVVCSHSYLGDFRLLVRGEDPNKVSSLVGTQMKLFRKWYYPHIKASPHVNYVGDSMLEQNMEFTARKSLLQKLPLSFQNTVRSHHAWYLSRYNMSTERRYQRVIIPANSPEADLAHDSRVQTVDMLEKEQAVLESLIASPELPEYIRQSLIDTVRLPSITQALKGIVSAGILKSLAYSFSKLKKSFNKKKQDECPQS